MKSLGSSFNFVSLPFTVSSSPTQESVELSTPPKSSPPLSQEQKDRIARNREAALQRRQKRVDEAELEFLIDMEGREEEDKRNRAKFDTSFGGFAYADGGSGAPNAKRARNSGKESQLMTDMRNVCSEGSIVRIQGTKVIDTGGGFLIEEGDLVETEEEEKVITFQPGPFVPGEAPNCEDCGSSFSDSYLLLNFDYPVCDSCKLVTIYKLIYENRAEVRDY